MWLACHLSRAMGKGLNSWLATLVDILPLLLWQLSAYLRVRILVIDERNWPMWKVEPLIEDILFFPETLKPCFVSERLAEWCYSLAKEEPGLGCSAPSSFQSQIHNPMGLLKRPQYTLCTSQSCPLLRL